MDGECLGLGGEESNGQQAENTKEILDDGMFCVGLGGMGSWVHTFVKAPGKTEFYFSQRKEIEQIWGDIQNRGQPVINKSAITANVWHNCTKEGGDKGVEWNHFGRDFLVVLWL